MNFLSHALTFVVLAIAAVLIKGDDVLVTVEQGTLRGQTAISLYNTTYSAFVGIPYAEPPLGVLRFQAPQPARSWDGIRNATRYGRDCLQLSGGSEDCLYLNVYVPGVPEEGANLPVIVWVHGGGFTAGSGSDQEHGPDFLVSYGVILVTINYRLGALGFLSTEDSVVPGNAGLKDQRQALQWVQRNIARFGGDPRLVTLQGQSAGGVAVSYHLVANSAAGLFSRVIDESGTLVASISETTKARYHAFRLGAVLGLETEDSQELVDYLRTVDASDLLVNDALLTTDEEKLYIANTVWTPNIEPQSESAFLTESPISILNEGSFVKVPLMIGVTSAELGFTILGQSSVIRNMNENFEQVVGPCLHLTATEDQTEAALKLRKFYFGNETISADNPEPLVQLNLDITFFEPTDSLVRKLAELTDVPVYYYEFDYAGPNVATNEWGVIHSGELPSLFVRKDTKYNLDPESEEDRVRRNVLRLWTNFAKYGNPTPEADPVVWEPYDLTSRSYLLMQANFSLAQNKDGDRMDFWNKNVPLQPYPGTD